jgi:hypothetical protein
MDAAKNSMAKQYELNNKIVAAKNLLVDKIHEKLLNSDDLSVDEMREIRELLKELSSN